MYLNHLCTDRELIEAAQYAENPHLRLLAERLDDKLTVIQKARNRLGEAYKIRDLSEAENMLSDIQDILES